MPIAFATYRPSPSRAVTVGLAAGAASRLSAASILPARLSSKAAGETLDYPCDLDAWLAEIDDQIVAASAGIARADGTALGSQDLGVVWLTLIAGRPVLLLSGGGPGVAYQIALDIRTAGGRHARFALSQQIDSWDAATAPALAALPPNALCTPAGAPLALDDGAILLLA